MFGSFFSILKHISDHSVLGRSIILVHYHILFQHRIWEIAWTIWNHRNQFLHQTTTLHTMEIAALNKAISSEWNLDIDNLPRNRYTHLFCRNLPQRLNDTPHFKQLWLASIWSARDLINRHLNFHCPAGRNAIALKFHEWWKKKIKN